MTKKIFQNEKGITLVEVLVSMFIFSLIIVMLTGTLITNLRVKQRIFTTQRNLGEINYAMEYISRLARMARKDIDGSCIGYEDYTYNLENEVLKFFDYQGRCISFFEEDERVKIVIEGEETVEGFLTSSNIVIENFQIRTIIDPEEDQGKAEKDINKIQPSITVLFTAKEEDQDWFELDIQTTITRRGIDFATP